MQDIDNLHKKGLNEVIIFSNFTLLFITVYNGALLVAQGREYTGYNSALPVRVRVRVLTVRYMLELG